MKNILVDYFSTSLYIIFTCNISLLLLKISRYYNQRLVRKILITAYNNNIKGCPDYDFLSRNLLTFSIVSGQKKKAKEIRLESRVINFTALVRDSISWRQVG